MFLWVWRRFIIILFFARARVRVGEMNRRGQSGGWKDRSVMSEAGRKKESKKKKEKKKKKKHSERRRQIFRPFLGSILRRNKHYGGDLSGKRKTKIPLLVFQSGQTFITKKNRHFPVHFQTERTIPCCEVALRTENVLKNR